jgi:hypothetical protein
VGCSERYHQSCLWASEYRGAIRITASCFGAVGREGIAQVGEADVFEAKITVLTAVDGDVGWFYI